MLRPFPPIDASILGYKSTVKGFGFENLTPPPSILPNQINVDVAGRTEDQHLLYSALGITGPYRLLRCGPIDTPLRAQELKVLVAENSKNKGQNDRIASFQLADTGQDLLTIKLQHYLIKRENTVKTHLTLPFVPFFHPVSSHPTSSLNTTTLKLSRIHNVAGWLHYSRWINEEFIDLLRTIKLDATEKFPLQASLDDYTHEMSSTLLQSSWQSLDKLTLQTGSQEFPDTARAQPMPYQQIIEVEKQILDLQIELKTYLQTQTELLMIIVGRIDQIVESHPELLKIKAIARLYNNLLEIQTDFTGTSKCSLGRELLIITLLNALLGVTPIFNCNTGLDRIGICFSISLALLQMLQNEKLEDMLTMILEWDKNILSINRSLVEKRQNFDSQNLELAGRLTIELRQRVFLNLLAFALKTQEDVFDIDSGLTVHLDYLDFIPDQYVEYDNRTGWPLALKRAAMPMLQRL